MWALLQDKSVHVSGYEYQIICNDKPIGLFLEP